MKIRFFKKRRKLGLVLSSGAARGLAHVGVLRAIKEKGIFIDMIAGSSMGALIGACYAKEGEIGDFEEVVLKTDWKELVKLADPNLSLIFKGVIHGLKVKELLKAIIGDIEFKDLKIPLAVVATDVNTGEEVVIREGSVVEAVRASISIPGIFIPVKFKKRFLMDGGTVNPVPVSVAKDMGATFIIASNAIHRPQKISPLSAVKKPKSPVAISKVQIDNAALSALNDKIDNLLEENKDRFENLQKFIDLFKTKVYKEAQRIDSQTPNMFYTILQAIYAMEYEIAKSKVKGADIVIIPNVGHIAALEFYRGKEAILEGYKAAKEVV